MSWETGPCACPGVLDGLKNNAQSLARTPEATYPSSMQAIERRLVAGDGFAVADVRREGDGEWTSLEPEDTVGVLFVRNGCFRRDESLLDVTSVYVEAPGRETRALHRQGADDRWTSF